DPGGQRMDANTRPVERSAATADEPGTPSAEAFKMAALVFLVPLQVAFAWLFVADWLVHVGERIDASATVPLLLSAATAALFVGTVATELVLLARRRRDFYQVAFAAFVLINLARIAEAQLLPPLVA